MPFAIRKCFFFSLTILEDSMTDELKCNVTVFEIL